MPTGTVDISPITLPMGLVLLRALPLPRILGVLERIYGRSLEKHGVAWVQTSSGVTWKLDLGDSCQRWIVYGDYEGKQQMDWIRDWLRTGGVVVDSGANIGQFVLYLAPLADVQIHAFEPVPECANWLRECLEWQGQWRVTLVEAALSEHMGTIQLQLAGPHSTARMDWYQNRKNPRIDVKTLRLDDYVHDNKIGQIRLWKLDVEGSEAQALAGAERLLSHHGIDALLVETSAESSTHIHAILAQHGYLAMRIGSRGVLRQDSSVIESLTNRIFVRPELEHSIC